MLEMSRPEFAAVIGTSAASIEKYEAELTDELREKLSKLSVEKGFPQMAALFRDSSPASVEHIHEIKEAIESKQETTSGKSPASAEALGDKGEGKGASEETLMDGAEYSEHAESDSKWLSVLHGILKSGNSVAIEALTRNLLAFDRLVQTDRNAVNESYQVPTPEELQRADDLARATYKAREWSDSSKRAVEADRTGAGSPAKRTKKRSATGTGQA
jgi:hypothetical protein